MAFSVSMADEATENLTGDEAAAQLAPSAVAADALTAESLPESLEARKKRLEAYVRQLLHIRVPVQVTLAAQRKSVQEIIELGPGSIVKFEKTCDQPLELTVGGRTIAHGEVVKVGDKFGVRISGMLK